MKRALLIGINKYPGQPLNGCVNDVTEMASALVAYHGFSFEDIRLLVDERATAAGIRERLDWLVSSVGPADTIYLHFSGHGTLFTRRDSSGAVTDVNACICPVDFDWTEEHAIFDAELRLVIDRVPIGTEFVFVSDSCYSGNLTRGFAMNRARYYYPPADIAWRLRTAIDNGMTPRTLGEHDRCGLISGCRADQESADAYIQGKYHGALTYHLLDSLAAPGGRNLPLTRVVEDVRSRLAGAHYDQVPQLHGPDDILGRSFLAAA